MYDHSQGNTVSIKPPPNANAAITMAPCNAPAVNIATSNAEYNKPHGNKAQAMPSQRGANICFDTARVLPDMACQTRCAVRLTQSVLDVNYPDRSATTILAGGSGE